MLPEQHFQRVSRRYLQAQVEVEVPLPAVEPQVEVQRLERVSLRAFL